MTESPFFLAADAQFRASKTVSEFIDHYVRPVVDRATSLSNPAQATYKGYLLRVVAWMRSLAKLNHPGDFQAVSAAARSLFEIVIDLTLLKHDPDCPVDKLLDWETSAKFKMMNGRLKVVRRVGGTFAVQREALYRDFIQKNETAVRAARQRWWGGRHPQRWSGRNLSEDSERCDVLTSSQHGSFYRLRYSELCWNTHGSGFAGIRDVNEQVFPTIAAEGFRDARTLARAAAAIVLALCDRYDDSMIARFEQLERECSQAMAGAFERHSEDAG